MAGNPGAYKRKDAHNKNQLEAIVEYIAAYCEKEHITKLPDICMPPLPEILYYTDSARRDTEEIYATVGLLDDPDRHTRPRISRQKNTPHAPGGCPRPVR